MNKITLFQTNESNSRGTSMLRKAGLAAALTALTLAPLGLGATPAQADNSHHDRREIRHDRREIRRDQRELRRDRRDFRREHGRPAPGRPAYGRPAYNRPNYNRPAYNRPGGSNSELIVRGTVIRDLPGNQFSVRTQYGITKVITNGESRSLSAGDYVELRGRANGGTFYARDVNIINNR